MITPKFVVSVDTSNCGIRQVLEDGLKKAKDKKNANFAYEIRESK